MDCSTFIDIALLNSYYTHFIKPYEVQCNYKPDFGKVS